MPTKQNPAEITDEKIDYIQSNSEEPNADLMRHTGLSEYVVGLVKRVQTEPSLQPYVQGRQTKEEKYGKDFFSYGIRQRNDLFTTRQIAEKFDREPKRIREACNTGTLEARKMWGRWAIEEEDALEYFAQEKARIMANNDKWLTTKEASEVVGLARRTLRDYCSEKKIQARKIGGIWYINKDSLKYYVGCEKS